MIDRWFVQTLSRGSLPYGYARWIQNGVAGYKIMADKWDYYFSRWTREDSAVETYEMKQVWHRSWIHFASVNGLPSSDPTSLYFFCFYPFTSISQSVPLSALPATQSHTSLEKKPPSLKATCPVWLINYLLLSLSLSLTIAAELESCAFKVQPSQEL